MKPLATILIAWTGVQAWVAVQHLLMYRKRRTRPEYLSYAILSAGFALYSLGAALMTDSGSLARSTGAIRLAYVGGALVAGALVAFCCELAGRGQSRLPKVAWAWALVGLGADLAGLFHDPGVAARVSEGGPAWMPRYVHPQLQLPGVIWVLGATLLAALSIARLRRALRADPGLQPLFIAGGIAVLAALHDLITHLLGLRSIRLFEHAAVFTTVLVGQLLVRRERALQRELDLRTSELEGSRAQLRSVERELDEKVPLATVGELSAVVALEVRSPLSRLEEAAMNLHREGLDDLDRVALLNVLDDQTDLLDRLVRDLLSYTRPINPQSKALAVETLVHEALQRGCDEGGRIQVETRLESGPRHVGGDPDLLCSALANVVANAWQAMPGGGTLTVRSTACELSGQPALCLTFEDTGDGMDTVVRARATAPFFTTRTGGTGLGLAIVERVIRAHGGTMEIRSRHGSGTAVTLCLPVEHPAAPHLAATPSEGRGTTGEA